MRIVAFVNKDSAVSFHRLIMPLLLMPSTDVYITNNLLVEHLENTDLFIYNRTLPPQHTETIKELKKKHGFKICVDIDDYWELDPHHVLYQYYEEIGYAKQAIEHLMNADVVLTTHERLAEIISIYNPNVHICPNAIPHIGQYAIKRKPYHLTRLFWQGSDTHQADIGILARPIDELKTISKKIQMLISGYVEDNAPWEQMIQDYTAKLRHQYKIFPYTNYENYYAPYAEADICLVPLVRSRFNSYKSNLKILEAANLALPVVSSKVHPYLNMPVDYCTKASDWEQHIKRLVQFPERQQEEGQRLKAFCDEHFNFIKINSERKQILEYYSKKEIA